MPHSERTALDAVHATALGVLHGPAELLPVSSSGHVALVPWLLDWPYAGLDPELRKAFEVALHAGTAAALIVALRDEVTDALLEMDRRRAALVVLSSLPPAVCALVLERPIERRLGTPVTTAVGLLLGIAQASALMPGVSRNGATLVAARLRRFRREDANVLSRHVALPIILAASALKGHRLAGRGLPRGARRSFAAGMAASFASTLASTWLIRQVERDRSLLPYAAYRTALAGAVLIRAVRKNRSR